VKIIEITGQPAVAITNEEADVFLQFDAETPEVAKSDLTDRQRILANQLVNKNLLVRHNDNGRIIYKKSTR